MILAVWLGTHTMVNAQIPSVRGTILFDGSVLGGVSLNLYADDGDLSFDMSTDTMMGTMMSGTNGAYGFAGLDPTKNYFVVQAAQTVGTLNLQSSVSDLLNPLVDTMLIDAFEQQQRVQGNPIVAVGVTNLSSASGTIIGGQRDLHVEYLWGPAEITLHANPWGLSQVLEFDQSAGTMGVATVTWDGVDNDMSTTPASNGLGGMDLTAHGGAAFSFLAGIDKAGAGDVVTLRIFSGDEVSTAAVELPVTNGTAKVPLLVPFSSFSGGASFDHVDAIQAEIGGNNLSIDAQLGKINVVGGATADFHVVAVPEPSAQLLASLSLLGLTAFRRRRVA